MLLVVDPVTGLGIVIICYGMEQGKRFLIMITWPLFFLDITEKDMR